MESNRRRYWPNVAIEGSKLACKESDWNLAGTGTVVLGSRTRNGGKRGSVMTQRRRRRRRRRRRKRMKKKKRRRRKRKRKLARRLWLQHL
jgi:hypothetical protein